MHVLIAVLHRPIEPTGVCRHAVNLAQCLADTDKVTKITLVIGSWQQDYFKRAFALDSPKIDLIMVDFKNNSRSRNLWFLFGLSKLAKRLNPDIVHLSFPIPFFRQFFACPVVATIHDFYPYEFPENFGYPNVWFNRWFLKQCIENSDGLSCVSEITLKNLYKYFPNVFLKHDTAVIYNYVDFKGIEPTIPQNIDRKNLNSFLLCVGQHRKNKNLDRLIQAYFQLRQNGQLKDTTKLIIIGANGPETQKLHALIETLNLKELVLLESSIDDRALCWLYQNCELFVIPSNTEGFCLPLAEAIYFSCRVVCSDIPIFREIGAEDCTYFQLEENSIENLQLAIADTLKQSPTRDRTLANYHFSKANIATKYLQLYCQVIQNYFDR
ncbi:MAG: glycosyltransferase family 4 protein [Xenococcaceae cyanobacterium]